MKAGLKSIIILFFVLLCIVLSFQIDRISDKHKNVEKVLIECQRQYERLRSVSDNKAALSKMQYYIEGDTLEDVELEKWNSNTKVQLSELLTNRPRLFFYISEGGCTSCYLSCLKKVSLLAQENGSHKIFVLAHFTDKKNLKYLLVNNQIKLDIYTLRNPLDLFLKDNSYPVLFLLSENLCIENAFITDKSNLDLLYSYLDVVEYRFLKTN